MIFLHFHTKGTSDKKSFPKELTRDETTVCHVYGAGADGAGGHDLNGAELSILWVVPFVCMLLSIAIGPLAVPHFWHHHFGKVALFWGLAFLVPCAMVFGLQLAVYQFVHVLFMEYVPFIILLFALFTIAGGVRRCWRQGK